MVETDPVQIIVELIDNVSSELRKIEARMEKLGAEIIDPEFEIQEGSEISQLKLKMKALERRITPEWDPEVSEAGLADVLGARQLLQRKMSINTRPSQLGDFDLMGLPNIGVFQGLPRGRGRRKQALGTLNEKFRDLGRTLNRVKPSIMDWWQVVALLIPIMITLGAAVVGVVAALGGMATAAAAVAGVGLIGWGDNASETMQELRMEVQRLKGELFAAISPAATEFAPISRQWVRGLPNQIARLNDELKRFTAFESGLEAAGGGLIGWVEEVLTVIADMRKMVVQTAIRIGDALGSFLIDLLSFGLKELYRNQDAYVKLAEAFIDIIAILFNLSKAITFALSQFKPLFDLVVALTGWMGNRWMTAILTLTIAVSGLVFTLGNLAAWLAGIQTLGFLSYIQNLIASLVALKGALWEIWAALTAVQKAAIGILATTGVGLALWAAGSAIQTTSGPSPGTAGTAAAAGGPTTVNDITIQGDVGDKEMHRLLDHLETKG